jgi:hypothetical protein
MQLNRDISNKCLSNISTCELILCLKEPLLGFQSGGVSEEANPEHKI